MAAHDAPVTIAVVGAGCVHCCAVRCTGSHPTSAPPAIRRYWGKNYVRSLSEMAAYKLKYVIDSRPETQSKFTVMYPAVSTVGDIAVALEDAEVQALVIATPASTHYELGMAALNAGKHVIIEKPLATQVDHAIELRDTAAAKGLKLLVGFTAVFIPSVMHAKSIIDSDAFGTPFYMHSTRTNLGIIRPDVNVSWDLVPHDIAVFLYWNAHPVEWVSATGVDCVKPGTKKADVVFVSLKFANGVMAHVMASWADPKKCRETFIVSNKMRLAIDDVDMTKPLQVHHQSIKEEDIGEKVLDAASTYGESKLITTVGDVVLPKVAWSEPLKNQIMSLHSLITVEGYESPASADLGVRVVQVLDAIDTSLQGNGAPVYLEKA